MANYDFESLLLCAAKAAGYEVVGDHHPDDGLNVMVGKRVCLWQPLDDCGDAMRLAIQLNLKVKYHKELGQALVWPTIGDEVKVNVEECNRDPFAAMRLAIVMAAAAIGAFTNKMESNHGK